MKILTISGSAQKDSSNTSLLKSMPAIAPQHAFNHFDNLSLLPLFTPERENDLPDMVLILKKSIVESDMVVICTPEYLHNIPAVLKNALEWVKSTGELYDKKVLPITYTPNPPRGAQAMQSLIWSLQALNATIVAELFLYKTELNIPENGCLPKGAAVENLKAIFDFIG